jgi:hypothetical protein
MEEADFGTFIASYLVRLIQHDHLTSAFGLEVSLKPDPKEDTRRVGINKGARQVHDGYLTRQELRLEAGVIHV